jgi:hypothetical protein
MISAIELARSGLFAIGIFIVAGTVAALWSNPLFIRMTPTVGFEYFLLAIESGLAGLYLGLRSPACSVKAVGSGGLLGFLGIACPVCNKILMLLFGGNLLLTYFEPIRPFVGLAGVLLVSIALLQKLQRRRRFAYPSSVGGQLEQEIPSQ